MINYGFRGMTTNVDAVIQASSGMKDAISRLGDRYHLPYNWLNADFERTESYSPRLAEHSTYYKTFSNVVEVRTVAAEYLIAMKLRSGRRYKHDLSDVAGILSEHKSKGKPITMEQIRRAVCDLYGDWTLLPEHARQFIEWAMRAGSRTSGRIPGRRTWNGNNFIPEQWASPHSVPIAAERGLALSHLFYGEVNDIL